MKVLLFVIVFWGCNLTAQIPDCNRSEKLDIGQLNLEWFGDSVNGPVDDELQLKNALKLITTLNLDLLSICEVSDSNYWVKLLKSLPQYSGIISSFKQTQKTALLYKSDQFKLVYAKNILSQYYTDFASGRLPLEVAFETNYNAKKDTIIVFVVHLKSNVGTSQQKLDSYNKRVNSSKYLKGYLDAMIPNYKALIIGDWNDDFDTSIYNNYISPFDNWIKDTNFNVITLLLSKNKIGTTNSYPDPIDHIVCNKRFKKYWEKDSVFVINPSKEIPGYSSNTTDHFPVITHFNWDLNSLSTLKMKSNIKLFWDGIKWCSNENDLIECETTATDNLGRVFFKGKLKDFTPSKEQLFFLQFSNYKSLMTRSFWILN